MKIHYALYDKATDTGGAKYWTWFEPPLTFELLDKFYGNFVVNNLPDLTKADLTKFPFSGGIVHIADTDSTKNNGWIVLYRSFYGGERDRGRHGTVLLTAWIRANETFEGLLSIFNHETFKFVEQHSKELPVPVPAALTEKIGGNLPEKWQKGLEKFAPYITPRFDSHLKIMDNPTGLNYEQSSAFAKDREEWEAEHIAKETELEEQAKDLKENATNLHFHLSEAQQRLATMTAERDKYKKLYSSDSGILGVFIKCFIGFLFALILMFIISYISPNWSVNSVNIVKSINPFTSLEKQIAGVDEKLKDLDKKTAEEKKKLETKKKELENKKQKKEQKKEGA